MSDAAALFSETFQALCTRHAPFRWQHRLFDKLAHGRVPRSCSLPTGLGKTSIIPIWLIALAHSARGNNGRPQLPRRLVYIVNRRTVVDQATDDAERLLHLLQKASGAGPDPPAIRSLWEDLARLTVGSTEDDDLMSLRSALAQSYGEDAAPLAVSTLRGELADNGEWKVNPARPAIVIGTIDMIGSKLLFSGYGDGRYGRAHHAGLIGQDTLIVHDEAHLSPAFSRLLRAVEAEQKREFERGRQTATTARPIRVMELSATTRRDGDNRGPRPSEPVDSFGIEPEDADDCVVHQRLTATKRLLFVEVGSANKNALADAIAAQARWHDGKKCRVLVYVRSPETAAAVREVLAQELADGVGLFTGTIRGYERDQLAESELFKAFRSDPHRPLQLEQTRYLVSTSAGEVGADLDADHLVCDLTTLDGTAQRFGRVNRLGVDAEGKPRTARITIVAQPPGDGDPLKVPLTKTKECLERLPKLPREPEDSGTGPVCDASPKALSEAFFDSDAPHRKDADEAISPPPRILPATDILFDSWALTSIMGELPGRPEVGPYLHGVAEWEPPETSVVWRAEIEELVKAGTTEDDLAEMLEAFPVRAVERAKDRVDRVQRELGLIAERHPDASAILIMNGEPRWATLAELAPADKNDKAKMNEARRMLAYATVILPTQVGGLKGGMLDGAAPAPEDHKTLDVAEVAVAGQRVRQRVRLAGDTETGLMGDAPAPGLPCRFALSVSAADTDDEDSPAPSIEYRVAKAESGEPGRAVLLSDHSAAVEAAAQRIGAALGLAEPFGTALALAAKTHDAGKARAVWQRYARNGQPGAQPLAKATRYLHAKALGGYRHEFGSLLDSARSADEAGLSVDEAGEVAEIANHPDRDLILHLVAAHHGWGRPHFEAKAFDRERPTSENEAVAVEVMQRFGRLQQRFGRWGLAWLESLFRCADAIGSQPEPSRDPEGAGSAGGAGVPPADSSSEHERAVAPDASHASAGDTCDGGHV